MFKFIYFFIDIYITFARNSSQIDGNTHEFLSFDAHFVLMSLCNGLSFTYRRILVEFHIYNTHFKNELFPISVSHVFKFKSYPLMCHICACFLSFNRSC